MIFPRDSQNKLVVICAQLNVQVILWIYELIFSFTINALRPMPILTIHTSSFVQYSVAAHDSKEQCAVNECLRHEDRW